MRSCRRVDGWWPLETKGANAQRHNSNTLLTTASICAVSSGQKRRQKSVPIIIVGCFGPGELLQLRMISIMHLLLEAIFVIHNDVDTQIVSYFFIFFFSYLYDSKLRRLGKQFGDLVFIVDKLQPWSRSGHCKCFSVHGPFPKQFDFFGHVPFKNLSMRLLSSFCGMHDVSSFHNSSAGPVQIVVQLRAKLSARRGNDFVGFCHERERNSDFGKHDQRDIFESWMIHRTIRNVFVMIRRDDDTAENRAFTLAPCQTRAWVMVFPLHTQKPCTPSV